MDGPEIAQVPHDDVDVTRPASQEAAKGDARDTYVRLSRRKLPLAVRACPTGLAADCAQVICATDQTCPRSRVPARG